MCVETYEKSDPELWAETGYYCNKHVNCDSSDCVALQKPQTLEEYKEALEHWMNHSWRFGCAHQE